MVGPLLDNRVLAATAVTGGDIASSFRVVLDHPVGSTGAATVFVKTHAAPPLDFFEAEAQGLRWLASAGAVRLPAVLAVSNTVLVLEWIDSGPASPGSDERLGRELAALHLAGAPMFGTADHKTSNYVGRLPQDNTPTNSWPEFYATRRLEPLVRQAVDERRLPKHAISLLSSVCGRIDELCGPPEPPARLHGDLWVGNRMTTANGDPVLVDPAAYGGHREVDLAMMRLFGGFSSTVFGAYAEVAPLADGHEERVALYQLYPLLVHVLLFGGRYADQALGVMTRYA
ncbi:MAG: fructosamine kinase family protein [Acidimicrobiales bacterium]|nr:fructosamine kinase family protein [Acidimicrobiales bacterium]